MNFVFDTGVIEITPFTGGVVFYSPNLTSAAVLPQFGIALAYRPEKGPRPGASDPPAR